MMFSRCVLVYLLVVLTRSQQPTFGIARNVTELLCIPTLQTGSTENGIFESWITVEFCVVFDPGKQWIMSARPPFL